MTIIRPDVGILFMKVGTHARETLADIIKRKTKEIEDTGFAMWGYGGNTCHPRTMVQPFAQAYEERNSSIYLCMQEMDSRHFAEPIRATEYSIDGNKWEEIPETINVTGSRFALFLEDLEGDDLTLPLARAKVAVGNSKGRPAERYIQGQVDKACLEILEQPTEGLGSEGEKEIPISLRAKLKSPYAAWVRN